MNQTIKQTINMKNSSGNTVQIKQTEEGVVGYEDMRVIKFMGQDFNRPTRTQYFSKEITMEKAAAIYGCYGFERTE